MIKIQKSDFVDNIFYIKKNEILVDPAELFNNNKQSTKKLIHKFKGESEYLIFFNSEQYCKMFAEFLNKFVKNIKQEVFMIKVYKSKFENNEFY